MVFPTTLFLALTSLVTAQSGIGEVTYYEPALGACGSTNYWSEYVCAVSASFFNDNPEVCGRSVTANYDGNSVTAQIVDICTGCAYDDLDCSIAAFSQIADPELGRIYGVTWELA